MLAINSRCATLDSRLHSLLGSERNTVVDFLLALADFEADRGHEALGYASLWDYCRRELRLLDCATYRRIHSMRLLRDFPLIEAYLRDGRLWMTSLVKLEPVISAGNVAEILEAAAWKSVREVEMLVASFQAKAEEKKATLRKLPVRPVPVAVPVPAPAPDPGAASASQPVEASAVAPIGAESGAVPTPTVVAPSPKKAKVQPLDSDLFQLTIRLKRSVVEKIEKAKKALSHKIPNGALEAVLEEAVDEVLRKYAKRRDPKAVRVASSAPKATSAGDEVARADAGSTAAGDGRRNDDCVPVAVRRAVFERDGGVCQWPLTRGGICGSDHQVEAEHRVSRAKGGASTVENLWTVCRLHNLQKAREEFGEEFMARFRKRSDFSQEKCLLPDADSGLDGTVEGGRGQ